MAIRSWVIVTIAALLAPAGCAWAALSAQPGPRQAAAREGPTGAAAMMPADSELVLVIENGRELRQTALGAAARGLFGMGGAMEGAGGPWRGLAAMLGWEETEAFDRLLGHRVTLVARGVTQPETARWALVSSVSADTSRRLKERLAISPRVIEKGQQIFALEQGRYELTLYSPPVRRIDREDDRSMTLILAPTGRAELLDEVLSSLTRAAVPTLKGQGVIARAEAMGVAEILLLARLGGRPGDAGQRGMWSDFVVVSARRTELAGTGWQARVALREQGRRASLLAAAESTDGAFEAMREGSLLTVVQRAPLEMILGASLPIDDPLSKLPWPARARELFTGAQAIRVARAADAPAGTGLVCTLAMETTDTAPLAVALDDTIAGFLGVIERQSAEPADAAPDAAAWSAPQIVPQYGGLLPHATRVMSIELAPTSPLAGVPGQGLTAAWVYASPREQPQGWWTLSLSGRGPDAGLAAGATREAGRQLVEGASAGQKRKWIWLMSARPSELDAVLPPALPDYRGVRSAMRRLSDIVCRLSITPEGDIEGEFVLHVEAEGRGAPAGPGPEGTQVR